MHRALSSFDVMLGERRAGLVQEDKSGWWIAYGADRRTIGEFRTPTAAREAIVRADQEAQAASCEKPA